MLCQSWCAIESLGSADERDVPSLEPPYRLPYPEKDQNQLVNKMEPDRLKNTRSSHPEMRIQNLCNRTT